MIWLAIFTALFVFASVRFLLRLKKWNRPDIRMDGKVVIITGGDSGIGKETAKNLAKRGATLYLAGFETERADKVRSEIIMECNNTKIYSLFVDLSSFDSIREFAKEFSQKETRLDVLINNAGMATSKYRLTKDGIESQFAVNYLGPFLLTVLLSKLLIKSSPSRVINVASVAHWLVNFDRVNLMSKRNYLALNAYAKSKLAVIMCSRILSRNLKKFNVTVNCLHPGTNRTTIGFNTSLGSKLFWAFCCIWANDPKLGCQTTVRLACDPDLATVTGEYYCDLNVAMTSRSSKKEADCLWLFNESLRLVNCDIGCLVGKD